MSSEMTRLERAALGVLQVYSRFSKRCSHAGEFGFNSLARLSDLTDIHLKQQISSLEEIVTRDHSASCVAARAIARARARFRRGSVGLPYLSGMLTRAVVIGSPLALRCVWYVTWLAVIRAENDGMLVIARAAGISGRFAVAREENFLSRAESLKTILSRPSTELRPYELLIWLVTHPCDVEEHVGDFFEMYDRRMERYGSRRAREWARRQAIGIAWSRTKNVIALITGASTVAHWISRHTRH
jgi:hypothetical protein